MKRWPDLPVLEQQQYLAYMELTATQISIMTVDLFVTLGKFIFTSTVPALDITIIK